MSDPNITAPVSSPPAEDTAPAPADDQSPVKPAAPTPSRDSALHDAFMLGWALVELGSRIQMALAEPEKSGLQLSSVWRAGFNRIAGMQRNTFPTCTTALTLYEPPGKDALPYLYPPEPDYANVGIQGTDEGGKDILEKFGLYGVTRRAINCLTLLYVNPDESLIPDVIKKNQAHLIGEILWAAQNKGAGGGDASPPGDISSPPGNALQYEDSLHQAKAVLTERTRKFLDAWDGYLRENYYVGGVIPNEDLELVAYEAGHSLSAISWGVAAATVPLEQQSADNQPVEPQLFVDAWKRIFRDQSVIRLQHQISALSSALDDSYYSQHPELKRSETGEVGAINPDLPSQAIQAVKNSIDYWQRAVDWVSEPNNQQKLRAQDASGAASWSKKMRLALSEQANIWQTLMTGQQTLRAFNMESVTHQIMQDVTNEIQKGLHQGFGAGVRQVEEMMKEMAQEVKDAIRVAEETAVNGLHELFRSCSKYVWLVAGMTLLAAIGLVSVYLLNGHQNEHLGQLSGGLGISGVLSAVLGYFGLGQVQKVKAQQQSAVADKHETAETKVDAQAAAGTNVEGTSLLTRIEGTAQETGKLVLDALERGYKQARIELDGLNRSVAVAYPLVEFFGLAFTLEADTAFLTEIIWSGRVREEEINRVVRAAFGSLAVFITPSEPSAGSPP